LDVGTGSGAIAVTLLTQRPQIIAVGVDCALDALAVARLNARTHDVAARLRLIATNVVDGLRGSFPLIVANLPYIPTSELEALQPEVAQFEPRRALDGGPDGLRLIGALLDSATTVLAERGAILAEIGEDQADAARAMARERYPNCRVEIENDAAGAARFLTVDRQA
jgi:release factor glutamine methyltransferase